MKLKIWILFSIIALVAGCGGGGGGEVAGPASGVVSTYATDSLNDDFDQVWVTIYKVTIHGKDEAVLMESAEGRLIDLKSLRDAVGARYALLDDRSAKVGMYRSVDVELSEDLSLVAKGTTTAKAYKFATKYAATAGRSVLRLPTDVNVATGRNSLVVDFDLATWDIDASGRVVANLRRGDGVGLDDKDRHEVGIFAGTITNLSGRAPNFTFNLARRDSNLIVKTDSSTRFIGLGEGDALRLVNGQKVHVLGMQVRGSLQAKAVKLEDRDSSGIDQIKGMARNVNARTGTFDIDVLGFMGFEADRRTYQVTTSDRTAFQGMEGEAMSKSDFFEAIASERLILVHASGSVADGAMAASSLKLITRRLK